MRGRNGESETVPRTSTLIRQRAWSLRPLIILALTAIGFSACASIQPTPQATGQSAQSAAPIDTTASDYAYMLVTASSMDGLAFIGRGGEIDGLVNPTLTITPQQIAKIIVINEDGMVHNFAIDELDVATEDLESKDQHAAVIISAAEAGEYEYYCSIPGHRQLNMRGRLIVKPESVLAGQSEGGLPKSE